MFDVGFSELLVIGIVALLVIGPEKLPSVARTVGALLGRMQRYVNDVKADINREIELDELKKLQTTVQDAAKSIETSMTDTMSSFQTQADELNKIASGDIAGLTAPAAAEAPALPAADAGAATAATDTATNTATPAAERGVAGASPELPAAASSSALPSAPQLTPAAPAPAQTASMHSHEIGSQSGAQASLALEPAPTNDFGTVPAPKSANNPAAVA